MPSFDTDTQDKIVELRALYRLGTSIESYEMVKVEWPSPDGTKWYGVLPVDEIATVPPELDGETVELRIIPDSMPDWYLPVETDSSIGDESIDMELWDADEAISQLMVDHGEGIRTTLYYYFPQVELLLPVWLGHLRFEDESTIDKIKLKAVQGFRASDVNLPSRAHYEYCMAVFGGLLETQEEIDEHDCPYNFHIGGLIGNNDPSTGLPWTYCDRLTRQSCIDRGVDPNFHLSHHTVQNTILNTQHGGPALLVTSQGNETNLPDPVRVIMGTRRSYGMPVMAYLKPSFGEHGWYFALYEVCEGPIDAISGAVVTVGGISQNVVPLHYNYRLGTKGQTPTATDLTTHSYSGTALIRYNFGYIDPTPIETSDASANAIVRGLNNIRIYSEADTYTTGYTSNRAWQIARMLCDKRWGYGYDYDRLNIESFIEAAAWCEKGVTYTDAFGGVWPHVRADSHPELIGKKVQQQFEDMCMAGNLSRPFLFDGKINIMPLGALTSDGLAACPVFTDEGDDRNILVDEDGRSTLTVSRRSDLDLVNRVEITFDDRVNGYFQTPLRPVEDIDAQLRAGRVVGDKARKINPKKFSLLGVVYEPQAIKMAWSILDRGQFDEGGLQNNLSLKFQIWYMDSLDLHQEKVIKVASSRLTKYGFQYFRIKKMSRKEDLKVELEVQAYNETYMASFEVENPDPPPGVFCSVTSDCPAGFHCWNGVCVPDIEPPPCDPGTYESDIIYTNGTLSIRPPVC